MTQVGKKSMGFMLSDWERKRRALHKLQRLASSDLPTHPFVYTLFNILAETVDPTDLGTGIGERFGSWLFNPSFFSDFDPKLYAIYKNVVVPSAGISGLTSPDAIYNSARTVLTHSDLVLPGYEKSPAWNEFFRPVGVTQWMVGVLRECNEFVGLLWIARSSDMKPWSNDDIDFLQMAAPLISHGFKVAKLTAHWQKPTGYYSLVEQPQAVILMSLAGRVLALNAAARLLFDQIMVFDRLPVDPFGAQSVKVGLEHIARILRSIFFDRGRPSSELNSPMVRIYAHAGGIVLKLRGFLTDGDPNHRYFTVIAEADETQEHRLQRLMYQYGLSHREAELLLRLKSAPSTNKEMAAAMGIRRETLKTYLKRIAEKLDLHGRTELTKFVVSLTDNRE